MSDAKALAILTLCLSEAIEATGAELDEILIRRNEPDGFTVQIRKDAGGTAYNVMRIWTRYNLGATRDVDAIIRYDLDRMLVEIEAAIREGTSR